MLIGSRDPGRVNSVSPNLTSGPSRTATATTHHLAGLLRKLSPAPLPIPMHSAPVEPLREPSVALLETGLKIIAAGGRLLDATLFRGGCRSDGASMPQTGRFLSVWGSPASPGGQAFGAAPGESDPAGLNESRLRVGDWLMSVGNFEGVATASLFLGAAGRVYDRAHIVRENRHGPIRRGGLVHPHLRARGCHHDSFPVLGCRS